MRIINFAPIYDANGVTLLSGASFLAQLYVGSAPESLHAVGQPVPFQEGFQAGYFPTVLVTLPDVPPGTQVYAQVRAWEASQAARCSG